MSQSEESNLFFIIIAIRTSLRVKDKSGAQGEPAPQMVLMISHNRDWSLCDSDLIIITTARIRILTSLATIFINYT